MSNQVLLTTNRPVAVDSNDHIHASKGGSGNDNSINPHFNERLLAMFVDKRPAVLDLGCAGGGFVKSLLDQGCQAVGLEGSDYCMKHRKFEWAALAGRNLFTCDITKPFILQEEGKPLLFDVVTSWEVMEHIGEADLPQLINNVLNHLTQQGVWIMSVSQQSDGGMFHKTLHDIRWWLSLFASFGLKHNPEIRATFDPHWVRGPNPTPWAILAPDSFHLVLNRGE